MIPLDRIESPRDDAWLRRLREPNEWWDAQYGRSGRGKRRRKGKKEGVSNPAPIVPLGYSEETEGTSIPPILIIIVIAIIGGILWMYI